MASRTRHRRLSFSQNSLMNLVTQGVNAAVGIIAVPIMVHALGDERFGLLSVCWLTLGYVVYLDFGLGQATVNLIAGRIVEGKREEAGRIFRSSLLIGVALSGAFTARRGKAGILNDLLPQAGGELVVFTDANTSFDSAAIRELVGEFADSAVGTVTGELVLHTGHASVGGDSEVSYWKFENWLKAAESDVRSTLGASGGIYAMQKELWRPLPYPKRIVDDFVIPMNILLAGRVVRYHSAARAYERAAGSISGEFARKIRIGASNFNGIPEYARLLSPAHGFVAFALWSHKIIRWFVPFLLLGLAAAGAALYGTSPFYAWVFRLTAAFSVTAIAGAAAEKFGWRVGAIGYPYYFLAMNFALFLGFFRSIAGKQRALWETVR